ncbi:MAG: hypothetical protein R3C04_11835 [Hyphomonas sp.]
MPDDDLFDAAADLIASESQRTPEPAPAERPPLELGRSLDPKDPNPLTLRRRFDDVQEEPAPPPHPMRRKSDFASTQQAAPAPQPEPDAPPPKVIPPPVAEPPQRPATANGSEAGWRDIISDMSRQDPPRDPQKTSPIRCPAPAVFRHPAA